MIVYLKLTDFTRLNKRCEDTQHKSRVLEHIQILYSGTLVKLVQMNPAILLSQDPESFSVIDVKGKHDFTYIV